MNDFALTKLSYGMYILTTMDNRVYERFCFN